MLTKLPTVGLNLAPVDTQQGGIIAPFVATEKSEDNNIQKSTFQTVDSVMTAKKIPSSVSSTNRPKGFVLASEAPKNQTENIFYLSGEIGQWLQKLQRYRLMFLVHGESGGGKSELVKQLANAFIDIGLAGGFFDLEQGGLASKDTQDSINRNIPEGNKTKISFTDEAEHGLESVKAVANDFDFIVVDSWQKLNTPIARLDELRREFPNTIWIIITQETTDGKARGGAQTTFDPPVRIKVYKIDNTFVNNYAEIMKNRGNQQTVGTRYNVFQKRKIQFVDTPQIALRSL